MVTSGDATAVTGSHVAWAGRKTEGDGASLIELEESIVHEHEHQILHCGNLQLIGKEPRRRQETTVVLLYNLIDYCRCPLFGLCLQKLN